MEIGGTDMQTEKEAVGGCNMTLTELCGELSVSLATGKNWVRLGKLLPSGYSGDSPYFAKEYAAEIIESIKSGRNAALKSRRNKKFISGNGIYNSYISDNSRNLSAVRKLFSFISENGVCVSENIMCAVLAECSLQLMRKKSGIPEASGSLKGYLRGELAENKYFFLAQDLINCFSADLSDIPPEISWLEFAYEPNEDILGLLYISLKNLGSRKAVGSYYTPAKIVQRLCEKLFLMNDTENKDILDPCCGSGNFILQLPPGIGCENVYGSDTDNISVMLARINYALKYGIADAETIYSHINNRDYLFRNDGRKFDIIIGNPPWGYVFSEEEKEMLRKKYSSANGRQIESYDMFVEQAILDLKKGGVFSFVLPEAILNVRTHTAVREVILEKTALRCVEFLENAFDCVQCPCIILQAALDAKPPKSVGIRICEGIREYTIGKERKINSDCISLAMTDAEYDILEKIDGIGNKVTLKDNADFALGIVTGNNKKYISEERSEDNEPVLKGADVFKFRCRTPDSYISFKPENFQQTAPEKYYRAAEKLFYRFIGGKLIFAYDDSRLLSLNSCNILIPKIPDLSIKYIMAVLNSRVAQFYFQKKFRSVKVLRSHIEQIPIPKIEKAAQDEITAKVDLILKAADAKTADMLYDELDTHISDLYNITYAEYNTIRETLT